MNQSLQGESTLPDLVDAKFRVIDEQIIDLQEAVLSLSDHIKMTQNYLLQLAKNQSILTEKMSRWPFITIRSIPDEPSEKNDNPKF
jgi:hypothetical protein